MTEAEKIDPWHRYQTRVLPALEIVAKKHGLGYSLADVATAFHLSHDKLLTASISSPSDAGGDSSGSDLESSNGVDGAGYHAGEDGGGAAIANSAAALIVPVRVNIGGTIAAKSAAEVEARSAGRRGAELSPLLDFEDLNILAEAVALGEVMRVSSGKKLGWEAELEAEKDGEEGDEEDWGGGSGEYRGPILFM